MNSKLPSLILALFSACAIACGSEEATDASSSETNSSNATPSSDTDGSGGATGAATPDESTDGSDQIDTDDGEADDSADSAPVAEAEEPRAEAADADAGAAPAGPPEPPKMKAAAPLVGALHVTWELPEGGCDAIELSRNQDGGDFELAYTLTGVATSQHDAGVSPPGEYCYQAVCVRREERSLVSNQVCGTP